MPQAEICLGLYFSEYDGFGVIVAYYIDNRKIQWYNYKKDSDYSSTNEDTFNYVVSGIEYNYGPFAEKMIFARDGSLICVKKGTFNSQGNFVSQKETLRVTYDSRGRVATVTDSNTTTPQVYAYSYKEDGSVEKVVKTGLGEIETRQSVFEEYVNLVRYSNYNSATGGNLYEYLKVYDRIKSITLPRTSEDENGKKIEYTYDGLNRITRKSRDFSQGLTCEYKLTEEYKYNKNYLSEIVITDVEGKKRNEVYDYDQRGNVTCYAVELINEEGLIGGMAQLANYTYDELNRLIREDNMALGISKVYNYDAGGNIETIYEYDYNGGEFIGKYTFIYAENYNSCHKNYLTAVCYSTEFEGLGTGIDSWGLIDSFTRLGWHNGVRVEYDSNGRLAKHGEMSFEYDSNGIRQIKRHTVSDGDYLYNGHQTDNITDHVYYTEGNIIHKEVIEKKRIEKGFEEVEDPSGMILEEYFERETPISTNTLEYYYDESGICAINYNGQNYHFQKNAFGDVVRIFGWDGHPVSEYVYDAWGNCKAIDLNGVEIVDSSHIANVNPFRYRGYYYDTETGFYYLQSRYYNPKTCRFITPDDLSVVLENLSTTVNGQNIYTYCNNNPVGLRHNTLKARKSISGSGGGGSSSLSRNLPSVPGWLGTLSTGLDHGFTMINPIRSAIACLQFTDLWDLMRLDGVTELPGALSKVATGIGWGLSIAGGVIAGYEKYASGASLSSSIAGGLINAGISIGGMYASTAIATAAMGALAAASLAIPGGVIIVGGAVIAVVAGIAINHLFTKLEIGGNTIEGHLNNFVDWLIFWD